VSVVSAAGLRNADIGGKSDPYCEASLNQLVRTTPVIQDSLDPVWNSEFHYFVQDKPAFIDFKLFDEDDYGKNDHLGDSKKDLETMWDSKVQTGESWEGDVPVIFKGKQHGTLHLKVFVRIMKPVKTEKKLEHTTKELESTSNKLQETVTVVHETKNKLEGTEKVLGQTKEELEAKEKALGHTKGVLEEKEQVLGRTKDDLEQKEKALGHTKGVLQEKEKVLGQTKEELEAKEKALGHTKGVLEEKEKVLGQTKEELEEKEKKLGYTQQELVVKKQEAEEKTLALAKTEEEKKKIQQELKEKYEKMMELQKQLESNKCEEDYLRLHYVHVDIISANGLRNADLVGKSDPFCEAVVQGLTRSTPVVQDSLDPVWNSKFAYFVQALPKVVDFHLWDEDDMGKNDALGDAKLDLEPLFKSGETFEGPLPVLYKGKQHGRVNVRVYCKMMHPVQTEHKLVETEGKLTNTVEQKVKVEKQLGEKEAELEIKFKEISNLTNGNSALKQKFDGLLEDLAVAQVSAKNLGEQMAESQKTNHQLRERIEELKNEMKEKINERDLSITQWEVKYKEIELKLKAFESDQSQKNYIEKIEKDNTTHKEHVQKLEHELKEAKEKATKAEEKAAKAEHEVVELKKSHAQQPTTHTQPTPTQHTQPTTQHTQPTPTQPTHTEPRKTETKSDYKVETLTKPEEKDEKRRTSGAPRPSTVPGSSVGKPASEDWLVRVNVIKGIGLRNPTLLRGSFDPFCEVTVQQLTIVTKTIPATDNPDWNHKLNFFDVKGTTLPDKIKFKVLDSNKFMAAALIGEAEVDLKQFWEKGTETETTVELQHKAKPAGKVNLQITAVLETRPTSES